MNNIQWLREFIQSVGYGQPPAESEVTEALNRLTSLGESSVCLADEVRRLSGYRDAVKSARETCAALQLQLEAQTAKTCRFQDALNVSQDHIGELTDMLKMSQAEVARIRATDCSGCRHSKQAVGDGEWCKLHNGSCEAMGGFCGRWVRR